MIISTGLILILTAVLGPPGIFSTDNQEVNPQVCRSIEIAPPMPRFQTPVPFLGFNGLKSCASGYHVTASRFPAQDRSRRVSSGPGCTIFNSTEGDWTLAAGNEDFNWYDPRIEYTEPSAGDRGMQWTYNRHGAQGGYQSGMNDQGLFFDGNSIPDTGWVPDPAKKNTGNLRKLIMRKCSTVQEVLRFYEDYNEPLLADKQHHWVDQHGGSVVVAYDGVKVSYEPKRRHFQVSTNFNVLRGGENDWRYALATDLLAQNRNISIALMSEVLSRTKQSNTVYSHVYNLKTGEVYFHIRGNFDDIAVINIHEELKRGSHEIYLSSLGYQPRSQVIAPGTVSFTPANNARGVGLDVALTVNFTERVYVGSGFITIKRLSDNDSFAKIDIRQVKGLGTDTISIDPVQPFQPDTEYYVLIDGTCLVDRQGDSYHGVTASTSWRFKTADLDAEKGR